MLLKNFKEAVEALQEKLLTVICVDFSAAQLGLLSINDQLVPDFLFDLQSIKSSRQLSTLLVGRHPEVKRLLLVYGRVF